MHLQMLDGQKELLVQPSTSTTPGAPLLCHYSSLTRLHLQLGIQLHLQPLCLHTHDVKLDYNFKTLNTITCFSSSCVKTASENAGRVCGTSCFKTWQCRGQVVKKCRHQYTMDHSIVKLKESTDCVDEHHFLSIPHSGNLPGSDAV
jgi:hypothetical protein